MPMSRPLTRGCTSQCWEQGAPSEIGGMHKSQIVREFANHEAQKQDIEAGKNGITFLHNWVLEEPG